MGIQKVTLARNRTLIKRVRRIIGVQYPDESLREERQFSGHWKAMNCDGIGTLGVSVN